VFTDPLPSNGRPIIARVSASAGVCLPSRCLAVGIHVTILSGNIFKHEISLIYSSVLKMEAVYSSETSVNVRYTIRCYSSETSILHEHLCFYNTAMCLVTSAQKL
jgi:hypothetical protein